MMNCSNTQVVFLISDPAITARVLRAKVPISPIEIPSVLPVMRLVFSHEKRRSTSGPPDTRCRLPRFSADRR
jgi:hypothetical protein